MRIVHTCRADSWDYFQREEIILEEYPEMNRCQSYGHRNLVNDSFLIINLLEVKLSRKIDFP